MHLGDMKNIMSSCLQNPKSMQVNKTQKKDEMWKTNAMNISYHELTMEIDSDTIGGNGLIEHVVNEVISE